MTTYCKSSYKIGNLDFSFSSNFGEFESFFFNEFFFAYVKIIFFTLKFGELLKKKHYAQPLKVKEGPKDKITLQIVICVLYDFELFEDQLCYIKVRLQIPLWLIPR